MTDDEQLRDPFALGQAATREAARQIRDNEAAPPVPGWEKWMASAGDWLDELMHALTEGRIEGKTPVGIMLTQDSLRDFWRVAPRYALGNPNKPPMLFDVPICSGPTIAVVWAK